MRRTLGFVVVCSTVLASGVAQAQRNVLAAGNGVFRGEVDVAIGRELLSPTRRLGVRLSLEYSRTPVEREETWTDFNGTTFVDRPADSEWQERVAGLRMSASYAPFRWVIRPYITAGIGAHDYYAYVHREAADTITIGGTTWPALSDQSWITNRLMGSADGGAGLSVHLVGFTLFGEQRWQSTWFRDPGMAVTRSASWPLSFGVRF